MSAKTEELFQKAIKLPPRELAELISRLWDTVDGFADPDLADEWEAEIARRVADIDSGCVTCIPGEEVQRELRERINARKLV